MRYEPPGCFPVHLLPSHSRYGLKLVKFLAKGGVFTLAEISALLVGCIVAFVVSMLAIRFLMNYVKKHTFTAFGWYRIALGIVVLGIWALQTFVLA